MPNLSPYIMCLAAVLVAEYAHGAPPQEVALQAATNLPPALTEVGIDQHLGEELPLDAEFTNEAGQTVRLGDYFGERPVLLTFVYYECPMLCTLVINGVVDSLRELPFEPGRDIEMVTISIDPGETPDLAVAKKANYLEQLGKDGAEQGWHFLTGSEESISKVTEAAGFRYIYNEESDEYAHASGIMVVTPEGQLSHYFFGIEYPSRDLRLALVEASDGKIGSPVDQLLLFCYQYDAATGKYSPAIMNFVRAGCALTILTIGILVVGSIRREAKPGTKP